MNEASQPILLAQLDDAIGTNPNVMAEDRYQALVAAVKIGSYQPILVRPNPTDPTRFVIVDGMHRKKAHLENGRTEIQAVVDPNMTEEEAVAIRIGMNRIRGDIDLGVAATQIHELKEAGWNQDQLLRTGFARDEIDDLLKAMQRADDAVMQDATVGDLPKQDDTSTDVKHVLELEFTSAEDLKKARTALKKRGGKGSDPAATLLKILEGGA